MVCYSVVKPEGSSTMTAEPPSNGEYLVAAYVLTSVILLGYWVALWRGASREKKSVSGERKT
jgi:hypothetical protein